MERKKEEKKEERKEENGYLKKDCMKKRKKGLERN